MDSLLDPAMQGGAFDDFLAQFAWAQSLPKPRAILIVSAHWESAPAALSATAAATRWSMTSAASRRACSP